MNIFSRTWFHRFVVAFDNPNLLAKARTEAFPRAFTRRAQVELQTYNPYNT